MSAGLVFTAATANQKVKAAQKLWNTRKPADVVKAYTEDTVWRNRDQFLKGHKEVQAFLEDKWKKENGYRLRKELFAFTENKIAVQFWYEYYNAELNSWRRCYGLEDWTFSNDGRMSKRQMSGNEIDLTEEQRWFKNEVTDVDTVKIGAEHCVTTKISVPMLQSSDHASVDRLLDFQKIALTGGSARASLTKNPLRREPGS
ncbi:MAG: hypothetical protein CYPHOPRED_004838 [Cyphobasidiales sp. Tagirdzhanova-0007]|nr:MAG: hypothetical protein CYPHOPRED_004838 [Cyphobasidiales sp. Tagirdzhanova-0007]